MINSKYYKLAGWGLVASSLYFLWELFMLVGLILFNLVTNGSILFNGYNIWETAGDFLGVLFIFKMPIGTALLGGGILVLMRMTDKDSKRFIPSFSKKKKIIIISVIAIIGLYFFNVYFVSGESAFFDCRIVTSAGVNNCELCDLSESGCPLLCTPVYPQRTLCPVDYPTTIEGCEERYRVYSTFVDEPINYGYYQDQACLLNDYVHPSMLPTTP